MEKCETVSYFSRHRKKGFNAKAQRGEGAEGESSKDQHPSSREIPRTKFQNCVGVGIWRLVFLWMLVLGIWWFRFDVRWRGETRWHSILPSLRELRRSAGKPSVKTPGYSRHSLRDNGAQRPCLITPDTNAGHSRRGFGPRFWMFPPIRSLRPS